MMTSITGEMNSGKTFLMSVLGFINFLKGKTIYTNYNVSFPHIKVNQDYIEWLGKFQPEIENSCFLLDEIWIWLDCRDSMINKIASYFFLQSQKDGLDILFTTQAHDQVEKRLRNNIHRLINNSRVILHNGEYHPINSNDRFLTPENGYSLEVFENLYIKSMVFERRTVKLYSDFFPLHEQYTRVKPFVKLFNTKQKIRKTIQ